MAIRTTLPTTTKSGVQWLGAHVTLGVHDYGTGTPGTWQVIGLAPRCLPKVGTRERDSFDAHVAATGAKEPLALPKRGGGAWLWLQAMDEDARRASNGIGFVRTQAEALHWVGSAMTVLDGMEEAPTVPAVEATPVVETAPAKAEPQVETAHWARRYEPITVELDESSFYASIRKVMNKKRRRYGQSVAA